MTNKRYVIYSAMVGAYDEIKQPKVVDDRFDYILFSNDIAAEKVGVWQVRKIDYTNADNTRICRYVKTHPEVLLPGYDFSVWMDSSIQIQKPDFYEQIVSLDEKGILISSMWHVTGCIYAEAFGVVYMSLEREPIVVDWCHRLRKEGYPRHNGLCETGVMYRQHNNCSVIETDNLWWKCILEYSRRDQLSFNYALWKVGIPVHYLLGEGQNVYNTELLNIKPHADKTHNSCNVIQDGAWLARYCWKHQDQYPKVNALSYHLFGFPFPHFAFVFMGQVYRIKHLLNSRH